MPLTARQLIKEMQNHIARHPESADFLVKLETPLQLGEGQLKASERLVLDLRTDSRHFLVE